MGASEPRDGCEYYNDVTFGVCHDAFGNLTVWVESDDGESVFQEDDILFSIPTWDRTTMTQTVSMGNSLRGCSGSISTTVELAGPNTLKVTIEGNFDGDCTTSSSGWFDGCLDGDVAFCEMFTRSLNAGACSPAPPPI